MSEHPSSQQIEPLLQAAAQHRARGDRAAARTLLRDLAERFAGDPRPWLQLATVAETREEQRFSLEQVLKIDPDNTLALRGLARFAPQAASPQQPAAPIPIAVEPVVQQPTVPLSAIDAVPPPVRMVAAEEEPPRPVRWPLFVVFGLGALALLVAVLVIRPFSPAAARLATPTPQLPGVGDGEQNGLLPVITASAGAATIATGAGAPTATLLAAGGTQAAATRSPATATSLPTPTTPPILQPGTVLQNGQWLVGLLRSGDAVVLDGSIGDRQPAGRFVVALLAIGNSGTDGAVVPPALITLQDERGTRYQFDPQLSATYLNAYGRGEHGNIAANEPVPPGGGIVSVPLLFDVPQGVRSLTLVVGDQTAGWPVAVPTPQ